MALAPGRISESFSVAVARPLEGPTFPISGQDFIIFERESNEIPAFCLPT